MVPRYVLSAAYSPPFRSNDFRAQSVRAVRLLGLMVQTKNTTGRHHRFPLRIHQRLDSPVQPAETSPSNATDPLYSSRLPPGFCALAARSSSSPTYQTIARRVRSRDEVGSGLSLSKLTAVTTYSLIRYILPGESPLTRGLPLFCICLLIHLLRQPTRR